MLARIIIVLGLLLIGAPQAKACQFVAHSLEEGIAAAKIAFVGTVRTVENGEVTFSIEKIVKGAKEGNSFVTDLDPRSKGSCGIDFTAGQRWLYLGNDAPSGSLQLQDEMGRPNAENLKYIKDKVGDIGEYGGDVIGGTVKQSCAPWDGAAFAIALDNGVSASVYASLAALDSKDKNAVAAYTVDSKMQHGGGSILQCPKPRDGQAENLPCRSMEGIVSIGFVTPDDMTGQIRTNDGEHHSVYVFHVKRLKDMALCG